jgi:hypothetical protein
MGYKPITSKDPHSKFLKEFFKKEFGGSSIRSLKYNAKTDVYEATVLSSWDGKRYTFKTYKTIAGEYARQYYKDNIADGFFSIHA